MSENRHLTTLARIALLVTAGDLATKAAAVSLLSHEANRFASWLHFAVLHNTQGAFGWSVGVYTWQLNFALTLAAIAFTIPVTRDLARVDARAPVALGLIVGGALGNLTSLVTSSRGVVDFIQVDLARHGVALNVADIAAYAGLAMILRTGAMLVAALRREAEVREPSRATPVRSVFVEKARLAALVRAGVGTDALAQPRRGFALRTGRDAEGSAGRRSLPQAIVGEATPSRRARREVAVMDLDHVRRLRADDIGELRDGDLDSPAIQLHAPSAVPLDSLALHRGVVGDITPRARGELGGTTRGSLPAPPAPSNRGG